jgi:membrane fusion protein, copper/silver efflux system
MIFLILKYNTMKKTIMAIAFLLAATATGFTQTGKSQSPKGHQYKAVKTMYTCPMHPEVVRSKPGKCPKCGMVLVKKSKVARKEKS